MQIAQEKLVIQVSIFNLFLTNALYKYLISFFLPQMETFLHLQDMSPLVCVTKLFL